MTSQTIDTREDWLTLAATIMAGAEFRGDVMPPVKLSCGFPHGSKAGKRQAGGECWSPAASADGVTVQIFVSPVVDEPVAALGILAHELCHAVAGIEAGHGPAFGALARRIGLEGKLTEAVPGAALQARLAALAAELGPYPHSRLDAGNSGRKADKNRQRKVTCPDCGYTCRASKRWLDVGAPWCPTHERPMEIQETETE